MNHPTRQRLQLGTIAVLLLVIAAMAYKFVVVGSVEPAPNGRTAIVLAEGERDFVLREMRGFGTYVQPPGTWSDDSSLLLCTVLSLTEHRLNLHDLGQRFVRYLTESYLTPHGRMFDIGMATHQAIERLRN